MANPPYACCHMCTQWNADRQACTSKGWYCRNNPYDCDHSHDTLDKAKEWLGFEEEE